MPRNTRLTFGVTINIFTPASISAGTINAAMAREISGNVYLNRQECASYMGMSVQYLAVHRHDGPRYLRVGSKILYRLSDVENWMRQQEVTR